VTCLWAKGNHFHSFTAFLHAIDMLPFGVIFKNLDNTRTSVIMKKCCLYGSEPETGLVVLPYVGIFQSCLSAKQPKQILPVVLSLDLWAMLPTLWSQLVTNFMEQNPCREASQILCFFMEPEISSPWSQKLTIYPCSEHDPLRPFPPPPPPPFLLSITPPTTPFTKQLIPLTPPPLLEACSLEPTPPPPPLHVQ